MKKLSITTIALYTISTSILLASDGKDSGGMPQLNYKVFPEQIFWFIVIFILLYLFISKYAVNKIKTIKSSRERLINQNYTCNNKNNAEAEKIKKIISLQIKDAEENSRNTIKKLTKELLEIEEKRINEVKNENYKIKLSATKEISNIDKNFSNNFQESLNEIVNIILSKLNVTLPKDIIAEQIKNTLLLKKDKKYE